MESLVLVTAVVGAVELLRRAKARDYFSAATIIVAGGLGILFGYLGAPGVADVWDGLMTGLGASGLVTVASRLKPDVSRGGEIQ